MGRVAGKLRRRCWDSDPRHEPTASSGAKDGPRDKGVFRSSGTIIPYMGKRRGRACTLFHQGMEWGHLKATSGLCPHNQHSLAPPVLLCRRELFRSP